MKKFTELSLKSYLEELSSDAPVPGGGSVAAYAASLAMGLTQMVGRISLKRKKKQGLTPEEDKADDERREAIQNIINVLEDRKARAFLVTDTDPAIYEKVIKDPSEANLHEAYEMQAGLVKLIHDAYRYNWLMKSRVSGSIKNDLLVAENLLNAAFEGAYHTAHINVVYFKDQEAKQKAEVELIQLREEYKKAQSYVS